MLTNYLINSVVPEPEGSSPRLQEPATGSYPGPNESTRPPHPTSPRSILISSCHLRLSLPSDLFPSDFSTKTLFIFLSSPMRAIECFVTNWFFLQFGVVNLPPNPQAGGPLPVCCPRLLIQYIRSYPPYLEAVSSIRNLRTRHAVVTEDTLNVEWRLYIWKICLCSWVTSFSLLFFGKQVSRMS
jgi:hypothetical protein